MSFCLEQFSFMKQKSSHVGPRLACLCPQMRVRQLLNALQDERLVQTSSLSDLENLRVGIDATYWLRTIQMLKDPFADAIGGAKDTSE